MIESSLGRLYTHNNLLLISLKSSSFWALKAQFELFGHIFSTLERFWARFEAFCAVFRAHELFWTRFQLKAQKTL